jgi:hypothetical protein
VGTRLTLEAKSPLDGPRRLAPTVFPRQKHRSSVHMLGSLRTGRPSPLREPVSATQIVSSLVEALVSPLVCIWRLPSSAMSMRRS